MRRLLIPMCSFAALMMMVAGCADSPATGAASPPPQAPPAQARPPQAPPQKQIAADAPARQPPVRPATTWSTFRGDGALTGVAGGGLPDSPELLWRFAAEGAIVSSPVVADGRVYFGSDDGNLYCLNRDSGEKLWVFPTEYLIEAPPLVHDGMVYIGSHSFFLYALDAATGELKWKYETFEKIVGGAAIVKSPEGEDWVVAGSHDAFVYAFDARTGEKKWEFETNDRVNATPAVVDNKVIFGGCDTCLYAVDGATGELASKVELGGDCHIASSVAVAGGDVYFGHAANEFVSIRLATGEINWVYPESRAGFFAPPAITNDRVLFGGRDNFLHCVDRATGARVWQFPTRRTVDSGPVVCGNKIVFGSGDGRLYIVALDTGKELWSYDAGKSIYSSAAVADGMIFIGANDGGMYAFGARTATSQERP